MRFFTLFLTALTAMALLAFLHPAHAEGGAMMTGRNLALLCNSNKEDDRFSCQSYIAGIIDYHNLIKSLGTAPTVDFCLPRALKMDDIRLIVMTYIARHTEHQDFIAAPGVAMALYGNYPCRRVRR